VRPADRRPGCVDRLVERGRRVHKELITRGVHVTLGAERLLAVCAFRTLIDDGSSVTIEWPTVPIAFNEVLLQLGADTFEEVPHVPDDGIIAQHRMPTLQQVVTTHDEARQEERQHDPPGPGARHGCPTHKECENSEYDDRQELSHHEHLSQPYRSSHETARYRPVHLDRARIHASITGQNASWGSMRQKWSPPATS